MVCRISCASGASLRATAAMPRPVRTPPCTLPQKPQCIKCLANCQHYSTGPQLLLHHSCAAAFCGEMGTCSSRRSDLCPGFAQFLCASLALQEPGSAAPLFFFDQKGLLLPDVGRKLQIHINYTLCPIRYKACTKFGQSFHRVSLYFHISASSNARISSGRGLSTATVRACSSISVSAGCRRASHCK